MRILSIRKGIIILYIYTYKCIYTQIYINTHFSERLDE
jgi:hypothetical protein